MRNYNTHDLARALLRMPDADLRTTVYEDTIDHIRTWAHGRVLEAEDSGCDPVAGRAVAGSSDPDLSILLEEVARLSSNVLAFSWINPGLRNSMVTRVKELRTREKGRQVVVSLMGALERHLKKLPDSDPDAGAASAEGPARSSPPCEPAAKIPAPLPTPAVPLPAGPPIPILMSPQAVPRSYAPNPVAGHHPLPRTFQAGCKAQLDYVTTGDPTDLAERRARFLEEALELVQSLGTSQPEAVALVEYVFGRPVGEPGQELGGTACTLAHLATWAGLDLDHEGRRELDRTWHPDVVAKIRSKRATRHGRGVLPGVASSGGSGV